MTQVKLSPPSFINLCANTDTRRNEQPNRNLVTFILTQKSLISNIMQMISFQLSLYKVHRKTKKRGPGERAKEADEGAVSSLLEPGGAEVDSGRESQN